jgi:hypothetical protein
MYSMSLSFLTLDIIILLVILIGTFIYSFNGGKKQVVKFLLAVYPALLIFLNLPFQIQDNITIIGAFIALYVVCYILLKKNFTAPSAHSASKKFTDSILLSIASVFTLLIIYYKILPLESLYQLRLPFSGFLIDKIPFYITMIIPIILIMITNRRDD